MWTKSKGMKLTSISLSISHGQLNGSVNEISHRVVGSSNCNLHPVGLDDFTLEWMVNNNNSIITIQSDVNDNQIGLDRLTLANEYVILLVSFFCYLGHSVVMKNNWFLSHRREEYSRHKILNRFVRFLRIRGFSCETSLQGRAFFSFLRRPRLRSPPSCERDTSCLISYNKWEIIFFSYRKSESEWFQTSGRKVSICLALGKEWIFSHKMNVYTHRLLHACGIICFSIHSRCLRKRNLCLLRIDLTFSLFGSHWFDHFLCLLHIYLTILYLYTKLCHILWKRSR